MKTVSRALILLGGLSTGLALGQQRDRKAHIYLEDITWNYSRLHPFDATVASVAHFGHGAIADIALRWTARYPDEVAAPPPMMHSMNPAPGGQQAHSGHHPPTAPDPASHSGMPAGSCVARDGVAGPCPGAHLQAVDRSFYDELVAISSLDVSNPNPKTPRSEVGQEDVSPIFAALSHETIDLIDWTHGLHEVLYDILASPHVFRDDSLVNQVMTPPITGLSEQPRFRVRESIPQLFALALDDYYQRSPLAISPAPLEIVIMERLGINEKPWFRYYRMNFRMAYGYFMVAHWWHPAAYETQIVLPEREEQQAGILRMDATLAGVLEGEAFPLTMLLSREIAPRFSSLTLVQADRSRRHVGAEAGNVFDNLHMLHGITYGILVAPSEKIPALAEVVAGYDRLGLDLNREASKDDGEGKKARKLVWEGKAREMAKVIEALRYRPGDEKLAARYENYGPFNEDPTAFVESWMRYNSGRNGSHCGAMMRGMGHCGGREHR